MKHLQRREKCDFYHSFGGTCTTKVFTTKDELYKLKMKRQKDQHKFVWGGSQFCYKEIPAFLKINTLCKKHTIENTGLMGDMQLET